MTEVIVRELRLRPREGGRGPAPPRPDAGAAAGADQQARTSGDRHVAALTKRHSRRRVPDTGLDL